MVSKSRIQSDFLGPHGKEETQILIRDNELLTGVIDKSQIGNSEQGLFHAFYELYDSNSTGKLMSSIAKMMTAFIQTHGFTCGVSDLMMTQNADLSRKQRI
jgi:DNA-directed RNA polymerase I subunit RPA1